MIASLTGGGKWRRLYDEEREEYASYAEGADNELRAARQRVAELERDVGSLQRQHADALASIAKLKAGIADSATRTAAVVPLTIVPPAPPPAPVTVVEPPVEQLRGEPETEAAVTEVATTSVEAPVAPITPLPIAPESTADSAAARPIASVEHALSELPPAPISGITPLRAPDPVPELSVAQPAPEPDDLQDAALPDHVESDATAVAPITPEAASAEEAVADAVQAQEVHAEAVHDVAPEPASDAAHATSEPPAIEAALLEQTHEPVTTTAPVALSEEAHTAPLVEEAVFEEIHEPPHGATPVEATDANESIPPAVEQEPTVNEPIIEAATAADEPVVATTHEPVVATVEPREEPLPVVAEPVPADTASAEPAKSWFGSGRRDNLNRLRGVDTLITNRLFALGVTTYDDIVQLSQEDEMALEQRLGVPAGFITREQWRTQASLLRFGKEDEFNERFGKLYA
ncbi:hypothetical protein U1839_25850 [Sphingomonas sp. RT2P30]|uniref:hypothetical protein n=1 Tax=Parasphingomonas halimpatiens TaxID=3096162 RepID=UPI002FC8B9A5